METRNISLTLEEAKEWYNNNIILKDVALKAFTKEELEAPSFKDIKSFKDACNALYLCYDAIIVTVNNINRISKASAAMYQLNIIRKALNLGYDLHLTKNPKDSYFYYPYNPFITKSSTYYKGEINSGKMRIIGRIKSEGKEYYVLGGQTYNHCANTGLGCFCSYSGVGIADDSIGFLGCATKEIAEHFGNYFGMLITKAKYGDITDFEIISKS